MNQKKFGVIVDDYCTRHYIKYFAKKYHVSTWSLTLQGIKDTVSSPLASIHYTSYLETMSDHGDFLICKGYFKVFASKKSAKSSGYRYIVKVDKKANLSRLLLIYDKTHIVGSNETVWWQGIIKNQFGL